MSEQKDWLQTELDGLTSLLEDSPVRTSALLADAKDYQDQGAAFGLSYSEYYSKFDHVGQSLRMSVGLELSEVTESSLSWIEQVTPDGRWWWVLSMPEPRTDGSECGLLPTPSAITYGRNKGWANPDGPERPSLETMAKGGMLPTPKASDGRSKGNGGDRKSPGLDQMAKQGMLPTPHANSHTGAGERGEGGPNLQTAMSSGTGPQRLSPCFVEWMMGYPAGFKDVND